MNKLLLCLTVVGLLASALSGVAGADSLSPTVGAIDPASGANDIGTPVTITGAEFAAGATVSLGSRSLANVTWVSSSTLQATVPWGLDPGTYALTVANPDGSTTLPSAYTVSQGIGQWNAGDLFGGEVPQLLMKPDDPSTLYAQAYGVIGLFRSDDAAEHWALVSDKAWANNNKFAVDQLHPTYVYAFTPDGLMRSVDKGDNWTALKDGKWPDGRDLQSSQVHVSPYDDSPGHPQALFVSSSESYGNPGASGALGLIKSTDGGTSWTIVPSLEGIPVQDIAFDPSNHGHLVAVTSDMKVYQSVDWGDNWSIVTTDLPSSVTSLGARGSITYNPYRPGELWITSKGSPGGIFKSTNLTSWLDVSPSPGSGYTVSFTGADSVYCWRNHSIDGGATWQPFGPSGLDGEIVEALAWGPGGELFVAAPGGVWMGSRE
jgi:hypothetical protein